MIALAADIIVAGSSAASGLAFIKISLSGTELGRGLAAATPSAFARPAKCC